MHSAVKRKKVISKAKISLTSTKKFMRITMITKMWNPELRCRIRIRIRNRNTSSCKNRWIQCVLNLSPHLAIRKTLNSIPLRRDLKASNPKLPRSEDNHRRRAVLARVRSMGFLTRPMLTIMAKKRFCSSLSDHRRLLSTRARQATVLRALIRKRSKILWRRLEARQCLTRSMKLRNKLNQRRAYRRRKKCRARTRMNNRRRPHRLALLAATNHELSA